jgi:hypothetical protein
VVFQFYGKVGTEKTKSQGEFLCTWQMRWSLRLWQVRLNWKQTEMRMRQRQLYIKNFGDLVNTAAPIHVKQDSLVHNVLAKFVTMPGEKEEYTARGKKFRLNVASSAGMLPAGPFMTTYYATKAYAASFTRAVERNV